MDAIVAHQSGERTTVLGHQPVPVPADLAALFPGETELVRYRRLRYDEETDEPVNWAENYVLPALADRLDPAELVHSPMTRVLRDRLGVRINRVTDTVEARLADPETAALLRVPLLSPILHCTGVVHDDSERVVDVARIRYRGDRFSFTVTMDAR